MQYRTLSQRLMMKRFFLLFLLVMACAPEKKESPIRQKAMEFFDNYKVRRDWTAFQNLYSDELVFEDVVFRHKFNKQQFINFYNWPDSLLKRHPDYPQVMVLEDLAITDSTAVGRGYFNPFYYVGKLYGDVEYMRFAMALHFDKEGKIKRHIDFIEYPPEFLIGLAERFMSDTLPVD